MSLQSIIYIDCNFSYFHKYLRLLFFCILILTFSLNTRPSPAAERNPIGWQSQFVTIFSDDLEKNPFGPSGTLINEYNTRHIIGSKAIDGQGSILLEGNGFIQTNPNIVRLSPNTYYAFEFDYKIIDRGTDDWFLVALFEPEGSIDDSQAVWPLRFFLKNDEVSGTYSSGALTGNSSKYNLKIVVSNNASFIIDNIKIFRVDSIEISSQPTHWKNIENTNYPRLGNYFGGTTSWAADNYSNGDILGQYTLNEIERKMSFSDVIIGFLSSHTTTDPDFARRIKNYNPNAILLPYHMGWEVEPWFRDYTPGGATIDCKYNYINGIKDEWIAKDVSGNIIEDPYFPGYLKMNMSEFCPIIDGMSWMDYHIDFTINDLMKPGLWDGVFFDNLVGRTHYFIPNYNDPELLDYDLNLNGIRDESPAYTTDITRSAAIKMLSTIRDEVGDLEIIMGNTGARPQIYLSSYVNGYIFECWSESWAYRGAEPSEASWRNAIEEYFFMLEHTMPPHIIVLEGCGHPEAMWDNTIYYEPTDEDLKKHRFLIGSALLGDGFYEYDLGYCGHSGPYLFDEYMVNENGVAVEDRQHKGYLGQPLGHAEELKSQSIVILEENFDSGTIPETIWGSKGVSISHEPENVIAGTGSLIIDNSDHTRKHTNGMNTMPHQIVFELGKTYLIEFDWKILDTFDVGVFVAMWGVDKDIGIDLNGIVAGDIGKTKYPITLDSGSNFAFSISLMNGNGKVAIDNLKITEGGVGPWRRDFENGFVLVNPINRPYTFTAEELAGSLKRTGIKRISGTQAPETNNGKAVTESLILQPFSAIILLADYLKVGDDDNDGYTEEEGDCDDSDATIFPKALDVCGDGVDQDCNGNDDICQTPIDGGYNVTSELWSKAILQIPGSPVTLVWKKVGADITPSGDQVLSGYFYADPNDFAYGSEYNPELFVKIYIAKNGWCNIAFNHVTVDDVKVYSAHNYDGTPAQSATATIANRLVENLYNGVSIDNTLHSPDDGYETDSYTDNVLSPGLWSKAFLQPPKGAVYLKWKEVGSDTTPSGDRVISGYYYADPEDFAYGSVYNPEVFVKVYIAENGWCNIAFNHVTVDEVTIYSAHSYNWAADKTGTAKLNNRLVEHQYNGVSLQ